VHPGHEDVFAQAWARGTRIIRATVQGARGSLLLRSHKRPSEFLAIARWESLEARRAFRRGGPPDPESVRAAAAVSELRSVAERRSFSSFSCVSRLTVWTSHSPHPLDAIVYTPPLPDTSWGGF
jgi:heme-degrading monooxygenase HmoA